MNTDDIERFDLRSTDPFDERLAVIRELFPEAIREGKVDFEALRRSVGDWVEPGPERFGLNWPGKADCMRVIQEASVGTLAPMPGKGPRQVSARGVGCGGGGHPGRARAFL